MNYKCPIRTSFNICDVHCRFYDVEPQKKSRDPDGPGSCALAQACRDSINRGSGTETRHNRVMHIMDLVEKAANIWGIK
jgi:hypothetical protein